MQKLSQKQREELHLHLGRPIPPDRYTEETATFILHYERLEKQRDQAYSRRVWSKTDIHEYMARHARECAAHAASLLSTEPPLSNDYKLTDAKGYRSTALGTIRFRLFTPYPNFPASLSLDIESTIVIPSIELHPSLRRKGFFSALQGELSQLGMRRLVVECVSNPSWAYALHQKSLSTDTVTLLSSAHTVDFEHQLSPGPTFAIKL